MTSVSGANHTNLNVIRTNIHVRTNLVIETFYLLSGCELRAAGLGS